MSKTRTPRATMPQDNYSVDATENSKPEPAPVATTAPAAGHTTSAARCYLLAKAARQGLTLQRPAKGLGLQWRAAGYKAPSVRHAALQALADVATDEDGDLIVTYEAAIRAFKALADQGGLGCSTPAARLAKFVRSGHLVAI